MPESESDGRSSENAFRAGRLRDAQALAKSSISSPAAISSALLQRRQSLPSGSSFSASTSKLSSAIAHRFIAPATNSTSINAQQQPRQ